MLVQGTVLKKATSVKKESEVTKLKEETIAFALESALNMRLGTCTRIHYCMTYLLDYTIDLICTQPQVSCYVLHSLIIGCLYVCKYCVCEPLKYALKIYNL